MFLSKKAKFLKSIENVVIAKKGYESDGTNTKGDGDREQGQRTKGKQIHTYVWRLAL